MTKLRLRRELVAMVALVFVAAASTFGQNEGASAVVDFNLAAGDQAQTLKAAAFATNDIIKLEVRATNTDSIVAHQFRLTYKKAHLQFNSAQSNVSNAAVEDNMLLANGGAIFLNAFTSALVEDPGSVAGDTTLLFAVTLDAATQTPVNSVGGNGLMGIVALRVQAGFTTSTTTTVRLENAKFIHYTLASNENQIIENYSITNGAAPNALPTIPGLDVPLSGTAVLLNWNEAAESRTFAWSASTDADAGDTVKYILHLGAQTFTPGNGGKDTSMSLTAAQMISALTAKAQTLSWYVGATDGKDTTDSSTRSIYIFNNTALVPVATARGTVDATGVTDTDGDTVKVAGVMLHTANFGGDSGPPANTSYYMYSGGAGINVFRLAQGKTFTQGDSVQVAGAIDQFRGLTEVIAFDTSHVRKVTGGRPLPSAATITIADYLATVASNEQYEASLIRINNITKVSGTWPSVGGAANLTVTDGTGQLTLRIESETNIDDNAEPAYPVNVIGIGTQFGTSTPPFNTGYQISPRTYSDISKVNIPPGAFTLVSPTSGTIVTVTSSAQTQTFSWNASVDGNTPPDAITYSVKAVGLGVTYPAGANTSLDLTGTQMQGLILPNQAQTARQWYVLASDGSTQTSSDTFDITFVNTPPDAIFISGDPGAPVSVGTQIVFGVSADDPTNDPLTYKWYVDAALEKTGSGTDTTFTRTFATLGTFDVKVVVSDNRLGKDSLLVSVTTTSVKEGDLVPTEFAVHQNFPNPFNPSTIIKFDLPEETSVRLVIYNILGQAVRTLIADEIHEAAFYSITWDGRDDYGTSLSSGVYLYRLQAGDFVSMKKMVLMK